MNNYYCVYKHTLPKEISGKDNDMVYIGITSQQPERRWANGLGYTYNSYFYKAIKKYGWNNFNHEILFSELTHDEANKKEVELISFYDSINRSKGYNFQTGSSDEYHYSEEIVEKLKKSHGGKNNGMYGKKHSEKSKKLMSNSRKEYLKNNEHPMTGKSMLEETKLKISKSAKARMSIPENTPFYNKHLSEETKSKLSQAAKLRYQNEDNPFKGKHHTNETKSIISQKAKERYKDPKKNPNYGNTKKVICLDTGIVYSSVEEVSKIFGLSLGALYKNCNKKTNRCGGFCFRYLDLVDKEVG